MTMMLISHFIRDKFVTSKLMYLQYCIIRTFCRQREFKGNSEMLNKLLGCSAVESINIINKNAKLQRLDETTLERAVKMLKRFGIQDEEILANPEVMAIRPATIEHHGMVLEEGGFTQISVQHLMSYLQMIKKRISLLKAHQYIPGRTDVAESFLSHLEVSPENARPLHLPDRDGVTFRNVYDAVLKHYLMWRLEIGPDEMERIYNAYVRIRHKSFRHLRRTIDILENELKYTKEKICKNGYLLHSHPDNTMKMLQNIESLGGMNIRAVMEKYPKIMMVSTDNLIKTNQYLKEYGFSDSIIHKCMLVFTLNSESVRQRLENLRHVPEFQALFSHPRVLRLVHYQPKALNRLGYLQEHSVRCASLHLLSSTRSYFERYTNVGEDRTRGTDTVQYLANSLQIDTAHIRKHLCRHRLWRNIPLSVVAGTLDFLLEEGYSREEIACNIQLLLYPRDKVSKELKEIAQRSEVSQAQELLKSRNGQEVTITGDMRLALCHYFLEKVHHFSGDGIWISQGDGEPTDFNLTSRDSVR